MAGIRNHSFTVYFLDGANWDCLSRGGKHAFQMSLLSKDLNEVTHPMKQPAENSRHKLPLAILEVVLVLLLARIAVEGFRSFTFLGRWEVSHHLNFSFGWILLSVAYGTLLVRRTSPGSVGLDASKWKEEFDSSARWVGNKLRIHPRWIFWLVVTYLVACFGIGMVHYSTTDLIMLFAWQLTATAIGEEVFFRGYVLGVVDRAAYGKTGRSPFTWGVIISSLLFGGLHLFNSYHFFGDKHDFAYFIAIQTTITGFLFSVIREKCGSIVPGVFLHALLNISSFTILPGFTTWIMGN